MNTLLYTSEEQAIFNKAYQYRQAYFDRLDDYQKALLQDFAQRQLEGAYRTASILLQKNPDYDYPTGCEGVERGQYWLDRVTAYEPAMAVLELFAKPKAVSVATTQPYTAPSEPVTSLRGLALEDVQELFRHPFLQSPGERAAALIILNVRTHLPGSIRDVEAWFKANVGANVSRELIQKGMKQYKDDGVLLSEKGQAALELVADWLKKNSKP